VHAGAHARVRAAPQQRARNGRVWARLVRGHDTGRVHAGASGVHTGASGVPGCFVFAAAGAASRPEER